MLTKHKLERNLLCRATPDRSMSGLHMRGHPLQQVEGGWHEGAPHRHQLITHQPLQITLDGSGNVAMARDKGTEGTGGGREGRMRIMNEEVIEMPHVLLWKACSLVSARELKISSTDTVCCCCSPVEQEASVKAPVDNRQVLITGQHRGKGERGTNLDRLRCTVVRRAVGYFHHSCPSENMPLGGREEKWSPVW